MPLPIMALAMALGQYAPGVIKLLTGSNKAEAVATHVIGIAKSVTGADTGAAALQAIQTDPAKMMDFQLAMDGQQHYLEQLYLADVQDARARDVKLVQAGQSNHRANVIAAAALLMVIICLLVVVWSTTMDDYVKATISLILGRALGWVEQIFSFEFGTTRASKAKDDTINKLSGS